MDKRIIGLSLSTQPDEPLLAAFKVTKGDVGAYRLDIKIYDGDAEFPYSQATTARMVFAHEADGLITTNDRGTVSVNGIAYNVEATEISRIGKMIGSVQLLDADGNRLTVSRFTFDVLADPLDAGGPLSTAPQVEQLLAYIAAAEQALNDVYGGVHIAGAYQTYEDFIAAHPTGTEGDIYLAGIVLYVWVDTISAWMNVGQIQGFGTPTDSDTIEFEYDVASGNLKAHLKSTLKEIINTVPGINNRVVQLENSPACTAYHNTYQFVPNSEMTYLALNSDSFDNDDMHNTSTNNSRLTCKTTGVYKIDGCLEYDLNGTGIRVIAIRKNGSALLASNTTGTAPQTVGYTSCTISVPLCVMNEGDYVELCAFQNSGAPLKVGVYIPPSLSMTKVAEIPS